MPDSIERKTLSIKNKPILWHTPTKVDLIEQELKQSARAIIDEYLKTNAATYDERFRINVTITRKMSNRINHALEELNKSVKYPAHTKQIFEKICNNVREFLMSEVGPHAIKFDEVLNSILQPKEILPKVVMPRPRL